MSDHNYEVYDNKEKRLVFTNEFFTNTFSPGNYLKFLNEG